MSFQDLGYLKAKPAIGPRVVFDQAKCVSAQPLVIVEKITRHDPPRFQTLLLGRADFLAVLEREAKANGSGAA